VASSPTKLVTFEEFEQLPDDLRGWRQELRHGEVIALPPPVHGHTLIQRRLRQLLGDAAGDAGEVETEIGYRPVPEHEYWRADVAFVSRERWDAIPLNGYLLGPPELVIEVLSPSNTAAEILEKKTVCLENGAREFWVVSKDRTRVEVSTPDGRSITCKAGHYIPLFFAPGKTIPVDEIFS
jgi:Uma2 family endonuclease